MDALYFYSRSADKNPGKGQNEWVAVPDDYRVLATIPNWRQMLSNFDVNPFVYDGKTYRTIEHAFQSKKIALVNPEIADYFTVESGHPIGKGDGFRAQKCRKIVTLGKKELELWAQMGPYVMEEAAKAKYAQCPDAMVMLLSTNKAQLWHIVPRKKPVRFEHLERIRDA